MALLPHLAEQLAAAGRDAGTLRGVDLLLSFPTRPWVSRCREAGISRVLFPAPSRPEGDLRAVLDGYAKLIG